MSREHNSPDFSPDLKWVLFYVFIWPSPPTPGLIYGQFHKAIYNFISFTFNGNNYCTERIYEKNAWNIGKKNPQNHIWNHLAINKVQAPYILKPVEEAENYQIWFNTGEYYVLSTPRKGQGKNSRRTSCFPRGWFFSSCTWNHLCEVIQSMMPPRKYTVLTLGARSLHGLSLFRLTSSG